MAKSPPPPCATRSETDLPCASDLAGTYNAYFESGYYESRYPSPNQHVLKIIDQTLQSVGREKPLLDFGCGSGRYLLPLMKAQTGPAVGFDISTVCLQQLAEATRAMGVSDRVSLIDTDIEALKDHFANTKAGVVMTLFGVISHIRERVDRLKTLRLLHETLDPDAGRLIISVPNHVRRFRDIKDGVMTETGRDITYTRPIAGAEPFHYHLYTAEGLNKDLKEAGFTIEHLYSESVLSESLIARNAWLGHFDRLASKMVPPALGYGILAVAKPI